VLEGGRRRDTAEPMFPTLALLALPALAYEVDSYTQREQPLADATAVANAHVDEILARAIGRTNRLTGCAADDATTRRIMAKSVERQTDPNHILWRRGGILRGWGFSSFSYWLETDPDVPIRQLPRHHNLYARMRLSENWALWLVDSCGVIRMGQVDVGTDKFDHFWDIGWVMYDRSDDGQDRLAALLHSLRTEGHFRGFRTSGAVSYADLRANYDGYSFYAGLLREGSMIQRGADGCLVQTRPWDWALVVDRDWDEFLNPSRYTEGAQRGIDRWMTDHDEQVCALDLAGRAVPPARVAPSEYLVLDALVAHDGRLPPGYDGRSDAFRRTERCPEVGE